MCKVSVIVVTHSGGSLLGRCLDALDEQTRRPDEVWVIVSNANDTATAVVNRRAHVAALGENVGFARAANAGFDRANGDLLVLLNDDTQVEPGFLEALRDSAEGIDQALLQPRILLADGTGRLDNVGHGLYFDGLNWARGRQAPDGPAFDKPGSVGVVSGAAFAITRSALEVLGGFDESLEAFGEDADLSLRAMRRGIALQYVPKARVLHELGATYGRYGARKVFLVERNRVRAAVRSFPVSALPALPVFTLMRWCAMGFGAVRGSGRAMHSTPKATAAAIGGTLAGSWFVADAVRKRRADAAEWRCGERDAWRFLLRERVSLRDLVGP